MSNPAAPTPPGVPPPMAEDSTLGLRPSSSLGGGSGGTFVPPRWQKPAPLGTGQAMDTATSVAAPLLAGFSVATIGVIASNSDKFRWPGVSLLALTAAAVFLVASLQFGFHARQHLYSPADVSDWWPNEDRTAARDGRLQREQHEDFRRWRWWVKWARRTYDAGIVTLAVGVAAALVPRSGSGFQEGCQWAAAGVAAAGAVGEAVWIATGHWARRR
jgi:hypothetical protein